MIDGQKNKIFRRVRYGIVVGTTSVAISACSGTSSPIEGSTSTSKTSGSPTHLPTIAPTASSEPPQPTSALPASEGNLILFSRQIDGKFDIFNLNLKTGAEENITHTSNANEYNLQLSPHATWGIFYSDMVTETNPNGNNQLWKLNLKNYQVTQLTNSLDKEGTILGQHWYDPTISPDGKTIACKLDQGEQNENGKIWLMDSDGNNLRELEVRDANGATINDEMWKPAFNSDGTKLYITVGVDQDNQNHSHIYAVNVDGSGYAKLITPDDGFSHWFPAPNPVRTHIIAFVSNRDGQDDIYIVDISRETYEITKLTKGPHDKDDPSWSKDGQRITFVERIGENFDVKIMNADGSNIQQITHTPVKELSPVFE